MPYHLSLIREIHGHPVSINGDEPDYASALKAAIYLTSSPIDAATAPAGKAATKDDSAKTATENAAGKDRKPAASSQASQTQNSADSSTDSSKTTQAGDAGASSKNSGAATGDDDTPIDYDADVKPRVLKIAQTSRDKVVALLQRYGAKTGKDLKADQYASFVADADRVLSGEYDPLAGDNADDVA
ncbi:hypothetical protein [Bordetella genomosp. 1]|uniref:Uncharacterized protein n=1 Tax=Bordetella genomosp. 1 TaxID=1395607 RepID=A0ABX4EW71_9BORD|nr:hypothetical protein [Bordetella genomosp. 1]OZI58725.1 hypothetical protein CAL27_18765 [Bordetella genomosp. 1]